MSVDFGFRGGPTYRPTTRNEMFQSALDLPMNQGATFFDQAKGGVLESFGLGTAIKDTFIPEGNTARDYRALSFPVLGPAYEATRAVVQSVINKPEPSLTEEQFKASPYHRDEIPYEPGMTEDRAAVLADWHDARKVREYFATKRPITSFVGNLAGQAIDPVNYLPVLGPLVKAGAVGKFGKVLGGAITGALDASSNTAIAALATQDVRGKAGDDVSWQSTVSQIATAALIGSVFGTIGGAVEKRADAKFRAATEERLSTLRTTQEARIALNEAIGAVVRGEDIRLSPNSTEPMARVAGEVGKVAAEPEFRTEVRGSSHGQMDMTLEMKVGGEVVGKIDFAEFDGAPAIQMIDVAEGQRRKGYATELLRELQHKYPDKEVDWGSLTAEGAKLREAIQFKDAPTEQAPAFAQLEAARATEQALDKERMAKWEQGKGLDQQSPEVQDIAARQTDALNTVSDLEYQLRNAQPTKQLMDIPRRSRAQSRPTPVDSSPARPDQPPQGIKEATAALSKPDDIKAIAAQYRVDPETGSYFEEPDIKQIDTEGRLTAGDKAELEAAQAAYEDGAAYGEALKAAVGCII